ncbi:DUF2975 domain-containing protein [Sphingomicrobium aestuariivivum]|uniref:DUF2975 domain-containing protein n=1 Tax=Sphingomicrobium aestuariivivum TaxID=1582356 RepID=UPI001FD6C1D0|nr:DUF2975 domain-containing protein [Sphingomicrobium aestuariivivum]MCJ8191621.1 DUF2975 domain-containing protein [Sphingomicrobium aestuariivivum]
MQSRVDPLLLTAKGVMLLMGVMILFTALVLAGSAGAVLTTERAKLLADLAAADAPASALGVTFLMITLIVAALAFAAWFIRLTWHLVRSVERGDPFTEENADRLRAMGWTSLLIQLLVIGATASARWLGSFLSDLERYGDLGINGAGFLLPLVLFILARVFRLGTQMRADLEGTV